MWLAITTLTRNSKPISANIDEKIDLISILTIFNEKKEEDIVDLDEELEIITTADGNKSSLDTLLNSSLIAMLLDLTEEYNLLNTKNETVTNLQAEEQNESQMNLFSIMFRLDTTLTSHKNKIDKYLKIDQVPVATDPFNWWKGIQQKLLTLAGLACKYLAMPATSTPSEWLFSSASNLMTSKHTSINTNLFEKILFLKQNINILGTIFESH
ncbi:12580_t:CDS:2 [Cetraspora pellucida]|uniref:12580_t:CDS:1 n=1 Tax=Cetraspora pellucida TaxID=1433469 RepID=A0ACA9M819_9GLOM|nr:12580_t:CDS:2 [Cetraspora pellucida]